MEILVGEKRRQKDTLHLSGLHLYCPKYNETQKTRSSHLDSNA